jgi:hypothetical protein
MTQPALATGPVPPHTERMVQVNTEVSFRSRLRESSPVTVAHQATATGHDGLSVIALGWSPRRVSATQVSVWISRSIMLATAAFSMVDVHLLASSIHG